MFVFVDWLEGHVPDCLLQRLVLVLVSELTGQTCCFQVLFLCKRKV